MPKKKPKTTPVDAYLEFKAVFKDWLNYENAEAQRAWHKAGDKLNVVKVEVVEAMQRLDLKPQDFSFDNPDIDPETKALLEQYMALNLEYELAGERMVASSRTKEGNYGPAFEAFMRSGQHARFLHLDMIRELAA